MQKPIKRSAIRQVLGREYFILKRRMHWLLGNEKWSRQSYDSESLDCLVFNHCSLIMRPLKEVDMHLQRNKRTNLKLAIAQINNTIIYPGEFFSFWKQVGRPTRRKGYLDGLVLNQGQVQKGVGGGLCQLGNLLFWIFAHSPCTITERHRHGFDVFPDVNRKVPFGAGATLSYNYIDFQIRNKTPYSFQLKLWLDESHLHGALFSDSQLETTYGVEERNHIIKQEYWGGYSRHNQIFKMERLANGEVFESLLVENHAFMMYSPLIDLNIKR